MNRCLTLLAIKEIQIKTKMICHFTPTQMTCNQKESGGEYLKNLDPLYIAGGKNVKKKKVK